MAKRKRRRTFRPLDETPLDDTPTGGRPQPSPLKGTAWRMFPFRGRFLSPETRYVYERLPAAPDTFSAADVAMLCVEADTVLEHDGPCNPAEVIDLLTSRSLVQWSPDGFVKRRRTPPRPRA